MPRLLLLFAVSLTVGILLAGSVPTSLARAGAAPEGKIAFVSGHAIYVIDADGTNQVLVIENESNQSIGDPAWSPYGEYLSYWKTRPVDPPQFSTNDAYVSGDSEPAPIANDVRSGTSAVWSPDGRYVAVSTMQGLLIVEPDGTVVRLVSDPTDFTWTIGGTVAWAPDGSRLAFVRLRESDLSVAGYPPIGDVYSVSIPGESMLNVSNAPAGYGSIAWSPDGEEILATSLGNAYRMPADGSGTASVLPYQASEISWSPDGDRLTYSNGQDVFVSNPDQTQRVNLTATQGIEELSPRWSPDGKELLFQSRASGPSEVRVIDAEGGDSRFVVQGIWGTWQPLYRMGDANCDKQRDSIDASLILQYVGGLIPTMSCLVHAHAFQDGEINALDATVILQYSAGLTASIPP